MNKLQNLQPWQIIAAAMGLLIVFAVASYFAVTALTTTKPPPDTVAAPVPALDSEQNKKTLDSLGYFTAPQSLPLVTEPLQTPDPDRPSSVNPFRP